MSIVEILQVAVHIKYSIPPLKQKILFLECDRSLRKWSLITLLLKTESWVKAVIVYRNIEQGRRFITAGVL